MSTRKVINGIWLAHGIGDVVMAIPALKDSLKKNQINIIFVKSKIQEDLIKYFLKNFNIKYVIKSDSKLFFYLKFIFYKYDNFYFVHGRRNLIYDIVLFFVRSTKKIIPYCEKNPLHFKNYDFIEKNKLHKVNYYRSFFKLPVIKKYNILKNSVSRKKSKINILISFGSGDLEKHKRWGVDKWNELIFMIDRAYDCNIYLIYTENERDLFEKFNFHKKNNIYGVKPESIQESIDLISKIDYVISVCNGTSHLASILNKPILGIYGPTNPIFTGVFGDKIKIIRKNYKCSPCYRPEFIKGCGNPKCMKDITSKEVFKKFKEMVYENFDINLKFISDKKSFSFIK